MSERFEMRFSGSGGQGVILASVILAEAAVIAGQNAVQSQSYGPEARGGMCKAETVISRDEIWFSKVTHANVLLALTQQALEKYVGDTSEDAVIIADESLAAPELPGRELLKLPILRAAKDQVGRAMTANIVAVGAINRLLDLFSDEVLEEAVRMHIPAGTEELNMKALRVGEALAEARLAARVPRRIA